MALEEGYLYKHSTFLHHVLSYITKLHVNSICKNRFINWCSFIQHVVSLTTSKPTNTFDVFPPA